MLREWHYTDCHRGPYSERWNRFTLWSPAMAFDDGLIHTISMPNRLELWSVSDRLELWSVSDRLELWSVSDRLELWSMSNKLELWSVSDRLELWSVSNRLELWSVSDSAQDSTSSLSFGRVWLIVHKCAWNIVVTLSINIHCFWMKPCGERACKYIARLTKLWTGALQS